MAGKRIRKTRKWTKFLLLAGGLIFVFIPSSVLVGAQLENNDAFCASCHTEPETTYYHRTQGSDLSDLAAFHAGEGVRCIDCHSGEGMNGRLHAMTVGSQDLLKFVSRSYPQPAPLTHPIIDENCLKCHQTVVGNREFTNHYHVFMAKWHELDKNSGNCVDCHAGHATDVAPQQAFLNEQQTEATCDACHTFVGRG